MKKELWLKVSSGKEYIQKEADIMPVLRTADAGEDKVILYCEKERSIKTLKNGVQANEELQTSFATLLGDQCVKVVEKQERQEEKTGSVNVLEALDRIADVLEDINGALIGMGGDIEALGDCIGTAPPRYVGSHEYKFLRIGGSIDTY